MQDSRLDSMKYYYAGKVHEILSEPVATCPVCEKPIRMLDQIRPVLRAEDGIQADAHVHCSFLVEMD